MSLFKGTRVRRSRIRKNRTKSRRKYSRHRRKYSPQRRKSTRPHRKSTRNRKVYMKGGASNPGLAPPAQAKRQRVQDDDATTPDTSWDARTHRMFAELRRPTKAQRLAAARRAAILVALKVLMMDPARRKAAVGLDTYKSLADLQMAEARHRVYERDAQRWRRHCKRRAECDGWMMYYTEADIEEEAQGEPGQKKEKMPHWLNTWRKPPKNEKKIPAQNNIDTVMSDLAKQGSWQQRADREYHDDMSKAAEESKWRPPLSAFARLEPTLADWLASIHGGSFAEHENTILPWLTVKADADWLASILAAIREKGGKAAPRLSRRAIETRKSFDLLMQGAKEGTEAFSPWLDGDGKVYVGSWILDLSEMKDPDMTKMVEAMGLGSEDKERFRNAVTDLREAFVNPVVTTDRENEDVKREQWEELRQRIVANSRNTLG